jgi:hypothetical protein
MILPKEIWWLSGVILMVAEWQLEVIRIRATRKELFSLPFFLNCDRQHLMWSVVFLVTMVMSYSLLLVQYPLSESFLSIAFFALGLWGLSDVQLKTIAGKPYRPPVLLEFAEEEIEMDLGVKKLDRLKHVSFWGDVWLLCVFISYVIILI